MKKFALLVFLAGMFAVGCYSKREDTSSPNDPKAPKIPQAGEKLGPVKGGPPAAGGGGAGMTGVPGGGPGMPKPPGK